MTNSIYGNSKCEALMNRLAVAMTPIGRKELNTKT